MTTPGVVYVALLATCGAMACSGAPAPDSKTAVTPPPATAPPAVVQPGAPGQASTTLAGPTPIATPKSTDADVEFMQGMIHHHAQALAMTALLYTRTARADMKDLAKRIDISQTDEIKMMRNWLTDRGQTVMVDHAAMGMAMPMMPGMLTPAQMAELANAKGPAFDRLFLKGMIQHHGGALVMVEQLFAARGGQESVIFDFASHVDADQRAEMSRMAGMLKDKS